MKKITMLLTLLASFTFFSSSVIAAEGEGTIDEIRVCGAASVGFVNNTFFKLSDGQWFVIFTTHTNPGGYNDNASYSLAMAAYAARYKVKVKATHNPSSLPSYNYCDGIAPSGILYNDAGDYIALKEYSQPQ